MTNRVQDTVLGVSLLVLASVWTWLVVDTIRPGFGDGDIGPRAFPLTFGLMLLVLSALLLLKIALNAPASEAEAEEEEEAAETPMHWLSIFLVLGEIALYGYLLEKIGFLLATPAVVLLAMTVSLRVRSLPKLAGMSLGLTVGCWLLFEKLLGIPLANGVWVNLG